MSNKTQQGTCALSKRLSIIFLCLSGAFLLGGFLSSDLLIRVDARQLDDTVVDKGRDKQEDETSQLKEGVLVPELTIRRARLDGLDDKADDPNDSSTDGLEDSAVDGTEGVSDEHAVAIVQEHGNAEEKHSDDQALAGGKADEGVDGVLERVMLHGRVVTARDDVGDRASDKDHEESTPETLEADDTKRRKSKILEKELLSHDLTGLDDLRANDQSDTDGHAEGVGVTLRLRDQETGSADDAESDEAGDDTDELVGLHTTARKEDARKNGGEDNHGATEHLEDGDGHIDETVCHHGGGDKIEHGRDSDDDRIRLLLRLLFGLDVNFNETVSVHVLILLALLADGITNPAHRKGESH